MDIHNKVIAITGAAQGLGQAMAVELAEAGANLALIDLEAALLDQTLALCEDINPQGGFKAYGANVCDEAAVESVFKRVDADFGELHGLINNAGLLRDAMLIKVKDGELVEKMSLNQWQAVMDVNLTGTFLCGREAAALMATKAKPGHENGVIINIASISKAGNMGQSNYSATKAGAASLVVTWARELGRHGIRVGGIAPGVIETSMTGSMKPEALDRLVQAVPVKRLGQAQEVAKAARFIFENGYFSGRVLELDGGLRI
ncbi:MAG: SDR family oxidoreductase [Pseudomonadales bacterium]|jgi:3-oxoacyl-[acyl-carrier protein] reductase